MNMQEPQQLFVLAQSKWWLGLTDRLAYKPNRNLERVKTYHHPGVPEWIAFPRFCKDLVHSKAAEMTLELRITMPSSPACRPCKISPPWMSCAPIRPERWPPPRWASIWKRFGLPRRMEPWETFLWKVRGVIAGESRGGDSGECLNLSSASSWVVREEPRGCQQCFRSRIEWS